MMKACLSNYPAKIMLFTFSFYISIFLGVWLLQSNDIFWPTDLRCLHQLLDRLHLQLESAKSVATCLFATNAYTRHHAIG